MQGFADDNVVVVGHDGEKTILRSNQEDKLKDLGSTSCIGDGPGVPEEIGHGFRESGGDGAQVDEGEVEEEEVHGGVEVVVTGYDGDDETIAQEGSQVDAQEDPEVQELQLLGVCKCWEEELGGGAAVWTAAVSVHWVLYIERVNEVCGENSEESQSLSARPSP